MPSSTCSITLIDESLLFRVRSVCLCQQRGQNMPVTGTAASFGTVCMSWTKCGQNCSPLTLWLPRSDGEHISLAVSRDEGPLRFTESVWACTGCFQPKFAILTRHMHVSESISETLRCLTAAEGKLTFDTAVADRVAQDGKSQTGYTAFQLDIPSSQSTARGRRQQRVIRSCITSRAVVQ